MCVARWEKPAVAVVGWAFPAFSVGRTASFQIPDGDAPLVQRSPTR